MSHGRIAFAATLIQILFRRLRQLRGDLFRRHELDAAPQVVAAPQHAISRSVEWQAILSPKRRNTWQTGELIPVVRRNCYCGQHLRQNTPGELFACPARDPAHAFSERTPIRMSKSSRAVPARRYGWRAQQPREFWPRDRKRKRPPRAGRELVTIITNVHVWRGPLGGCPAEEFSSFLIIRRKDTLDETARSVMQKAMRAVFIPHRSVVQTDASRSAFPLRAALNCRSYLSFDP